jgi:hypothetical protein
MSRLSEKVDRRTAARYEVVLRQTATDLLATRDSADRHLTSDIIDRDAESMITSPDASERRTARSGGESIKWLTHVAIVICRWTYERIAL